MGNSFPTGQALWVNLTRDARTALADACRLRQVGDPRQLAAALARHAPPFVCFEFDDPGASGLAALCRTRHAHPTLPILMITARLSASMALWALRLRIWDVLQKPLAEGELEQRIGILTALSARPGSVLEPLFPPPCPEALAAAHAGDRHERTYPAIADVAEHFDRKTSLEHVAALCQLSASQFCRVFRQEHGMSFAQYLLRYRIDLACERLAQPGARAKDVAYSVGFNDLSYFAKVFKRQVGVSPSQYPGRAISS